MQQTKARLESGSLKIDAAYDQKQRRKMMLALVLMVVALIVVLVRDHSFWFGSDDATVAEVDVDDAPAAAVPATVPATTATHAPAAPASVKAKKHPGKVAVHAAAPARVTEPPPAIVASNRKALPPLEIEVVAGDSHRPVQPKNNPLKVDMPSTIAAPQPSVAQPATASTSVPAAERVRMSPESGHVLERKVDPSYPLLARQMKVQGSVVLQALISKDGLIQDLRVLSGPGILANAAQEAVRQWRFKPYLLEGQPVETEANITVNFTISTF